MRASLVRFMGGKGHKMKHVQSEVGEFDYIPKQWFWKPPLKAHGPNPVTGWTPRSQRTGVIAKKVGMSTDWTEWNVRVPLTYLQLEDVVVVSHKTEPIHGYNAVQLGARTAKLKHVRKPQQGHFEAAGVDPKRLLREFRVTPDAFPPVGAEITVKHFVPGQRVNVQGRTKGKGYQGVMKRHGFSGGPASHGASKSHRSLGSTGSSQDPGHVIKGKRMPGHMGNVYRTATNLLVFKIIPELNVMAVVGHVPGAQESIVTVWDSNKPWKEPIGPPPFPAYVRTEADVIRDFREVPDNHNLEEIRGPMPLPWELRAAQQGGWHIPTQEEIQNQIRRGRIHQLALGEEEDDE